jgi:hypothetical protein
LDCRFLGRADRAEEGQPVVTGFSSDADLPVVDVAESFVLEYEANPSRVVTAICFLAAVRLTAAWRQEEQRGEAVGAAEGERTERLRRADVGQGQPFLALP